MQRVVTAAAAVAALAAAALCVAPAACTEAQCVHALEHPDSWTRPHARQLHPISDVGRLLLPIAASSIATVAKLGVPQTRPRSPYARTAVPCSYAVLTAAVATSGLTLGSHISVVDNADVVTDSADQSTAWVSLAIASAAAATAALAATHA